LIDDVITPGVTLSAAAKRFNRQGQVIFPFLYWQE